MEKVGSVHEQLWEHTTTTVFTEEVHATHDVTVFKRGLFGFLTCYTKVVRCSASQTEGFVGAHTNNDISVG